MSVIIEEYLENITVSVEAITDDITVQVSIPTEGGGASTVIVDNLTTASPLAALSANQGVVLKGFINDINITLGNINTIIDEINGTVV